jgi:hypothetical protein
VKKIDGKKKKKFNIQKVGAREMENQVFTYNGSGVKVRVLKIVKQIQTNVKQNYSKKKNETFK